jgi:hypothetical protein
MSLPADITANATCDIYRTGGITLGTAGVSFFLTGAFENIKPTNTYDYMGIFGLDVDIRDGDWIYVPQFAGGTTYTVVRVTRVGRGTPADRLVAYMNRTNTPYPTIEI